MTSLTSTQIGSVVYAMIDNIPTGISGILPTIVNQQIYFAEKITGDSIGATAIADVYQPAIINLTAANVLQLMEAQGMGTKSVSIGELSITKGLVEGTSKTLYDDGLRKLQALGEQTKFYQTFT